MALITPDFHGSDWTDQEIGWALGRGVFIIPVLLKGDSDDFSNPYGFIGEIQGMRGDWNDIASLAVNIMNALLKDSRTCLHMRQALVEAFENSDSYGTAIFLKNIVVKIQDFTSEEIQRLRMACIKNRQVSGASGVSDAIYKKFGDPPENVNSGDEVPF